VAPYSPLAMGSDRPLHALPEAMCVGFEHSDGFASNNEEVHFAAMLRVLDREQPDHLT
jgi:hypothetical protein